jgi:hypothetical protein
MGFTNVEGDLVALLTAETSRPASTGRDPNAPRFYSVRRTGGPSRLRGTDFPLVVVEAYAQGGREDLAMADLNQARGILLGLRKLGDAHVKRVSEVGGPGNLPDPRLPLYARYTSTFEIEMRS